MLWLTKDGSGGRDAPEVASSSCCHGLWLWAWLMGLANLGSVLMCSFWTSTLSLRFHALLGWCDSRPQLHLPPIGCQSWNSSVLCQEPCIRPITGSFKGKFHTPEYDMYNFCYIPYLSDGSKINPITKARKLRCVYLSSLSVSIIFSQTPNPEASKSFVFSFTSILIVLPFFWPLLSLTQMTEIFFPVIYLTELDVWLCFYFLGFLVFWFVFGLSRI